MKQIQITGFRLITHLLFPPPNPPVGGQVRLGRGIKGGGLAILTILRIYRCS
jgi:hypothetical protein